MLIRPARQVLPKASRNDTREPSRKLEVVEVTAVVAKERVAQAAAATAVAVVVPAVAAVALAKTTLVPAVTSLRHLQPQPNLSPPTVTPLMVSKTTPMKPDGQGSPLLVCAM
jgi:hypothetical protein